MQTDFFNGNSNNSLQGVGWRRECVWNEQERDSSR